MARTVVVRVRASEDPEKLLNSAAVAGYNLVSMAPEPGGEAIWLALTNSSATNPEATATYFEQKTGRDITP